MSRPTKYRLRPVLALLAVCVLPGFAGARAESARSSPKGVEAWTFGCDAGPFGAKASAKSLAAALGAGVVAREKRMNPSGEADTVTTLFAALPNDKITIEWGDEAQGAKSGPNRFLLENQAKRSDWIGPLGVRLGMTIEEVEKLNGRPFKLSAFNDTEGAGVAGGDWSGGAFDKATKACVLWIGFSAGPANGAAAGADAVASNDHSVRAAHPVVSSVALSFVEKR